MFSRRRKNDNAASRREKNALATVKMETLVVICNRIQGIKALHPEEAGIALDHNPVVLLVRRGLHLWSHLVVVKVVIVLLCLQQSAATTHTANNALDLLLIGS